MDLDLPYSHYLASSSSHDLAFSSSIALASSSSHDLASSSPYDLAISSSHELATSSSHDLAPKFGLINSLSTFLSKPAFPYWINFLLYTHNWKNLKNSTLTFNLGLKFDNQQGKITLTAIFISWLSIFFFG